MKYIALLLLAGTPLCAQEAPEAKPHHPGCIYSTHAEGWVDMENESWEKEECRCHRNCGLYGQIYEDYPERVEDDATAYPSKNEDAFYDSLTR